MEIMTFEQYSEWCEKEMGIKDEFIKEQSYKIYLALQSEDVDNVISKMNDVCINIQYKHSGKLN